MDNPHPLWACYGCHRQWQWRARPLGCGFCSCTYILPISENAVALVAFEREAADLARGGLGKVIRAPRVRVYAPRSKPITAGSRARLGW